MTTDLDLDLDLDFDEDEDTTDDPGPMPAALACTGLQKAVEIALQHRSTHYSFESEYGWDGDDFYHSICGLLLDYRDGQLHVVATDRYTLTAVTVETTSQVTQPDSWQLWLDPHDTSKLGQMLALVDPEETITLDLGWLGDIPALTARTPHRRQFAFANPQGAFPDWRRWLKEAIGASSDLTAPTPAVSPQMLARWSSVPDPLTLHAREGATGRRGAVVVTSPTVVGLLVPPRFPNGASASGPREWLAALTPDT